MKKMNIRRNFLIDRFNNQSKQQSRLNNVQVVQKSELVNKGKLVCSWCELMGETGTETLKLLEAKELLQPNSFIGVDLDKERINNFKSQRPELQWYSGNLFNLLPKLSNVGVLNLDIYGNIGQEEDYRDLSLLKPTIANAVSKFGAFVLFYNKDLDGTVRQKKNIPETLRYHTNRIAEVFNGYLPYMKIDPFYILPKGAEYETKNGFVGQLGVYEIYKGEDRSHRMVNLRLIFR